MTYHAPVKEMLFVMQALADLAKVVQYPAYAEAGADAELAPAVLEEAAKFNETVIAPLNWAGDKNPRACHLHFPISILLFPPIHIRLQNAWY